MLSPKYIAGFLDADGCIAVIWRGGKYSPQLAISFSQKEEQDKVIQLIHKEFGGSFGTNVIGNGRYSRVSLRAGPAEKLLNRIKKHLVIKRHYANVCLDVIEKGKPMDLITAKAYLKEQRRIKSLPLPNFPPRKWLAGYFDGDGCFFSRSQIKGACQLNASIACSYYDTEGIEIIHKSFGGSIRIMSQGNNVHQLWLGLPPSKAKQFIGYFAKHMIIKRDQAYFILGCAEMGHYRDGKSIKSALKQLKAHPHRLNEPEVDVASLLKIVNDKKWGRHGKIGDACLGCHRSDIPHYAKGYCRDCYNYIRHNNQKST